MHWALAHLLCLAGGVLGGAVVFESARHARLKLGTEVPDWLVNPAAHTAHAHMLTPSVQEKNAI
jgi:hypothetical protein